jgi:predicted HicB family RNase H-like nuclease
MMGSFGNSGTPQRVRKSIQDKVFGGPPVRYENVDVSFEVPADILGSAKLEAKARGISLNQLWVEAIETWLESHGG